MRLLHATTRKLHEFFDEDIPAYAIVSHTWRDGEVSFADVMRGKPEELRGYAKIEGACTEARRQGLEYVWVDTACIDKSSSAELGEAINSMFMWYRDARICFVYLDDVDDLTDLGESRWITRCWTLQELIAPKKVEFYSRSWISLGSRRSMAGDLSRITKIDQVVLQERETLESFNIATRMSWAARRNSTRGEDRAYCLMGIFNVNMPIMYGEGAQKSFYRLQEAILEMSNDDSILAWNRCSIPRTGGLRLKDDWAWGFLAPDPWYFDSQQKIISLAHSVRSFTLKKRGLEISLPIVYEVDKEERNYPKLIAILSCRFEGYLNGRIGVQVCRVYEDCVTDEAAMFGILNLAPVCVNFERVKKAEVRKIFLLRRRPNVFKEGVKFSSRRMCSVRFKPLLAQGYEVVHAEPEHGFGSWNSRTCVSEIVTMNRNPQIYLEFGFLHTAQNEAFVVSWLSGQDVSRTDWNTAMRVETKPQAGDAVTWLRSKGIYSVTGPSSPAEDWIHGAVVGNLKFEDLRELFTPSETSLLVSKQKLSSDASFSSVTVELKYVTNINLAHWALELSLTERAHDLSPLAQEEQDLISSSAKLEPSRLLVRGEADRSNKKKKTKKKHTSNSAQHPCSPIHLRPKPKKRKKEEGRPRMDVRARTEVESGRRERKIASRRPLADVMALVTRCPCCSDASL